MLQVQVLLTPKMKYCICKYEVIMTLNTTRSIVPSSPFTLNCTLCLSPKHHSVLLALLCATARQSYCRQAGVRRPSVRPSVKPIFSEPSSEFWGKSTCPYFSQNTFLLFKLFFFFYFFTILIRFY